MAKLKDIYPLGIINNPNKGFLQLLESFFTRTFFEPHIKDRLGLKGMRYALGDWEGLLIKVQNRKGIYGLIFLGTEQESLASGLELIHGNFAIHYFPNKDEKILDRLSTYEQILRLNPEFEDLMSNPPKDIEHPLKFQFIVGKIILTLNQKEECLFISLQSLKKWKEVQANGLVFPDKDGKLVEIVPKGGVDRDIPAFAISWSLFDKLIQMIAYQLKKMPDYAILKSRPGYFYHIKKQKQAEIIISNDIKEQILSIGFNLEEKEKNQNLLEKWLFNFFPCDFSESTSLPTKIIWKRTSQNLFPVHGNPLWWKTASWEKDSDVSSFQIFGKQYRPSLIIITGFLGSGKTTLLNRLIKYKTEQNERIAVIQNELGETSLDGKILTGDYMITEMEGGCLCCTLLGDLRGAIKKLCYEFYPDLIVIETTGIADPQPILDEIPYLKFLVRFDSLITVIDGANLMETIDKYPVIKAQIKAADFLLLNKSEMIDKVSIDNAKNLIKAINPHSIIITTSHANVNPRLLFATQKDIESFFIDEKEILKKDISSSNKNCIKHQGLDIVTQAIENFTIKLQGIFDEKALINFLGDLSSSVYRLKGIVRLKGKPNPLFLQFVSGRFEFIQFLKKEPKPNILVFIGQGLKKDILKSSLEKCLTK